MWMGLIQLAEDLIRTKTELARAKENPASRLPVGLRCNSSLRLPSAGLPRRGWVGQVSTTEPVL